MVSWYGNVLQLRLRARRVFALHCLLQYVTVEPKAGLRATDFSTPFRLQPNVPAISTPWPQQGYPQPPKMRGDVLHPWLFTNSGFTYKKKEKEERKEAETKATQVISSKPPALHRVSIFVRIDSSSVTTVEAPHAQRNHTSEQYVTRTPPTPHRNGVGSTAVTHEASNPTNILGGQKHLPLAGILRLQLDGVPQPTLDPTALGAVHPQGHRDDETR